MQICSKVLKLISSGGWCKAKIYRGETTQLQMMRVFSFMIANNNLNSMSNINSKKWFRRVTLQRSRNSNKIKLFYQIGFISNMRRWYQIGKLIISLNMLSRFRDIISNQMFKNKINSRSHSKSQAESFPQTLLVITITMRQTQQVCLTSKDPRPHPGSQHSSLLTQILRGSNSGNPMFILMTKMKFFNSYIDRARTPTC